MSLLIQMAMDKLRKGPSAPPDRYRRAGNRSGSIEASSIFKEERPFNVFLKRPTEQRRKPTSQPLGLGRLGSTMNPIAPGKSFARQQVGVSSKSRIIGGSRFDYNMPSQGYYYGE